MSLMDCSPSWQDGFLRILPAVQRHATIRFGRLAADQRAEAVEETIAAACLMYQRAVVTGRLDVIRPGPLADFAVRHVRTGRHVGGRQDTARDLLSPRCRARHKLTLVARPITASSDHWQQLSVADRRISVADLAAFRIDFAQWLASFSKRDRTIITCLGEGERPVVVASRLGIAPSRISQLRRRFEHSWRQFQGELPLQSA